MNLSVIWHCKYFDELTVPELYDIIRLRNEVFVVEQQCIFQDADNVDKKCYHFFGLDGDVLVAYARLIEPGITFTEASIGRVITSPAYRGKNVGKQLFAKAIEKCKELFGSIPLQIGAQLYLKKFYESFDFKSCDDEYLEDGIPHIHMILIL